AKLVYLFGRHWLLEGTAVREGTNGDALAAGLPLQHLAGPVNAEMVRNDKTGDDSFPKAPAGFNHPLIRAGEWIFGEQDASSGRVEKVWDHNADTRSCEKADPLSVGNRRVRVGRPPDFTDGARDLGG